MPTLGTLRPLGFPRRPPELGNNSALKGALSLSIGDILLMPFNHLAGTTTKGAADPIADWFATFEAWITTVVGWTLVAGAGTTDLWLSSVGEGGAAYTMLFVRIWQPAGTDTIRAEVADDAIPTHITNEGGALDIDGLGEFQYWISADLDAILMVVPYRGGYRPLYVGIIEPLAITPADERSHMVATGTALSTASILHHHTLAWDVDINNYGFTGFSANLRRSMKGAGNFLLMPIIADRQNAIAGQYKFLSYREGDPTVAPGDLMPSTTWGGTANWLRMYDGAFKYSMQISGAPPGDIPQAAGFAVATGISASQGNLIGVDLVAFLTGIGWTDLGDPGGPDVTNRLFYSPGEDGTRNIYVLLGTQVATGIHIYVQDDAGGTHRTVANLYALVVPAEFPLTYYFAGDLDGFSIMLRALIIGRDSFLSAGLSHMQCPNIAGDEYNMFAWVDWPAAHNYTLRRRGDDTWNAGWLYTSVNGAGNLTNSNANAYDLATYSIWPIQLCDRGPSAALTMDPWGTLRYIYWTNGGGIASLDTITIGGEVYTIGNTGGAMGFLAIRST